MECSIKLCIESWTSVTLLNYRNFIVDLNSGVIRAFFFFFKLSIFKGVLGFLDSPNSHKVIEVSVIGVNWKTEKFSL